MQIWYLQQVRSSLCTRNCSCLNLDAVLEVLEEVSRSRSGFTKPKRRLRGGHGGLGLLKLERVKEWNLFSVACENEIDARRASWCIVSSIEQKDEDHEAEIRDCDYSGDDDSVVSDYESGVSGDAVRRRGHNNNRGRHMFDERFVRLLESNRAGDLIRSRFVQGLGSLGMRSGVVSIHRNVCHSVMAQERVHCFQIFVRVVAKLRGGDPNVKCAWCGASGDEEVADIIKHGFGGKSMNNGLRLSPDDSPLASVKRCIVFSQ